MFFCSEQIFLLFPIHCWYGIQQTRIRICNLILMFCTDIFNTFFANYFSPHSQVHTVCHSTNLKLYKNTNLVSPNPGPQHGPGQPPHDGARSRAGLRLRVPRGPVLRVPPSGSAHRRGVLLLHEPGGRRVRGRGADGGNGGGDGQVPGN